MVTGRDLRLTSEPGSSTDSRGARRPLTSRALSIGLANAPTGARVLRFILGPGGNPLKAYNPARGMGERQDVPTGVWVTAGFFAIGGALHLAATLYDLPRPLALWPLWGALGRALLSALLAWGLWRRIALCRSIAMVYCLAVVITDAVVLAMAFAHAPVRFPDSLVWESLYEVPSCVLLFPFLRSPRASALFPRPLFGG
jgi:hypothetical protein